MAGQPLAVPSPTDAPGQLQPVVGEVFPYQGHFWKVSAIVQFPQRYKTRGNKYPAIAQLEWVSSYDSIESVLMDYLNLEAE